MNSFWDLIGKCGKSPLLVSIIGSNYLIQNHNNTTIWEESGHKWTPVVGSKSRAKFGLRRAQALADIPAISADAKRWFVSISCVYGSSVGPADSSGRKPDRALGSASGVLTSVDNKPYVVTSAHPIGDSKQVMVSFNQDISQHLNPNDMPSTTVPVGSHGQQLCGRVVYVDLDHDLAVIKLFGLKETAAGALALTSRATSRAEGEDVAIVGNPNGESTFNDGIISCGERAVDEAYAEGTYQAFRHVFKPESKFIQHCAPATEIFRGGPLLDKSGHFLGVNVGGPTVDIQFAAHFTDVDKALKRAEQFDSAPDGGLIGRDKHLSGQTNTYFI